MMEWYFALGFLLGLIIIFMLIGMPIAFSFLSANLIGAWVFMGGSNGIIQVLNNGFGALSSFSLVPIPLFLLMGELFFRTGLGMRMFGAVDVLMGQVPGRLSYVTVVGGTGFATVSGSSMGSTALLGSVLVPEMVKRGYKKHMSIGPIMGTGGLAIIIPPSALAVLLATLAKIDVGALLVAGVVPGFVLAGLYIVLIWVQTRLDPQAAPVYGVPRVASLKKVFIFLRDVLPMVAVMAVVVVMLMFGWATPSESAAFGALGVVSLAFLYRCMTWKAFFASIEGALKVTLMAFMIVLGSATFSQLLAFSGGSSGLISWATSFDLSPVLMLLAIFAVLIVLGTFMEQISIMMLTVPFFFPLAAKLGFDPIWFGVVVLLSLEISFTTPPFGLLLFVMKGVAPAGTSMKEIYIAAIPYILCSMFMVALLIMFPSLATWLPNMLQ
ncbi:TRAP transporter large permease [Orrella sp. 11846]|uniref:TRAP transporter large permease n=1 Tax=Orrella sp. 11846 TaxID=3409913 RepID=UPI003B5BFA55